MFLAILSSVFLYTLQPVHISRRQASEKGVAVVKAATNKCVCNKDRSLIGKVSSKAPEVPQLGKTTFTDALYMCTE